MTHHRYTEHDWQSYDQLSGLGTKVMQTIALAYMYEIDQWEGSLTEREYNGIFAESLSQSYESPYGIYLNRYAVNDAGAAKYAQDAYGDIVPQIFTDFATPNPCTHAAQSMIESLWKVAYALDPSIVGAIALSSLDNPLPVNSWAPKTDISGRVEYIKDARMKYWYGAAADNFETKFLDELGNRTPKQAQVAMGLALAVQAQQQAILSTHAAVKNLASETINALEQLAGGGGDGAALVAVNVAFAAVGVLMALPTDGLSIAGAVGLASATKGFLETTNSGSKTLKEATATKHLPMSGGTVDAIVRKLIAAASAIHDDRRTAEETISTYLDKVRAVFPKARVTAPSPSSVTSLASKPLNGYRSDFYPGP
jgi:hypothetical protein